METTETTGTLYISNQSNQAVWGRLVDGATGGVTKVNSIDVSTKVSESNLNTVQGYYLKIYPQGSDGVTPIGECGPFTVNTCVTIIITYATNIGYNLELNAC